MPERHKLISAFHKSIQNDVGSFAVLATIVAAEGSTFRHPGAKMLIFSDGSSCGSLTGSCMEQEIHEHAKLVFADQISRLVLLDSTDQNDHVLGYGIGCAGKIKVFLEPLYGDQIDEKVGSRQQSQIQFVSIIYASTIPSSKHIGLRTVYEDLLSHGIGDELMVASDDEVLSLFVEKRMPIPRLNIFGAGSIAESLLLFAEELGWRTKVFDHRPVMLQLENFKRADECILVVDRKIEKIISNTPWDYYVILTQNFLLDAEYIKQLLVMNPHYIGVMGSKKRSRMLCEEVGLQDAFQQVVQSPIGLDIATKTPATIALSIVAQIQEDLKNRFDMLNISTKKNSPIKSLEDDYISFT